MPSVLISMTADFLESLSEEQRAQFRRIVRLVRADECREAAGHQPPALPCGFIGLRGEVYSWLQDRANHHTCPHGECDGSGVAHNPTRACACNVETPDADD